MMTLDSSTASVQGRLRNEPLQPARPRFENTHYKTWLETCGTVLDFVDRTAVKIDLVNNNKSLTLEGKQAEFAKLAPAVLKEVAPLVMKPLRDVTAAMTRLTNVMLAPLTAKPKGEDPMITFLREQEIRRSIPKAEANAEYLKAIGNDDLETSRAITAAPGLSWISPETKERGDTMYAQRTNPQAWAQLQALDYYKDHLTSLVAQIRNWVLALGATPQDVTTMLGE